MPRAAAVLMTSPARRRPPMPSDNKRDYEVGFGKPPPHTRFSKGQSGNPRGRLHGTKNLKTLVIEALNQLVTVTENGGKRTVSKCEAIATQLVNRATMANWPAVKILLDILRDIEAQTELTPRENSSFNAADEKVIAQLKARFSKKEGT